MKRFMVRGVCGLAAAIVVAGAMLAVARPAEAGEVCYLITHYSRFGSEEIVINEDAWPAHEARHGDVYIDVAECPVDEPI